MQKHLSLLAAAALLVASASAQCLNTAGGTPITLTATGFFPADDEGLSAPIALGFNFPIAGATSATFSHVVVESNGVAFLTNGGPAIGAQGFGSQDMDGLAGDSPRIAPFWGDLEGALGGVSYSVTVDTSVAGQCTINWIQVNEFYFVNPVTFSVQAKIFATGEVSFSYSPGLQVESFLDTTVGISAGNGLLGASQDLGSLPTSTAPSLFEVFPAGPFDLAGTTILMVPSGPGYTAVVTCGTVANPPATHTAYGEGCYDYAAGSFYQTGDAATMSAAFSNTAITLLKTANGYVTIAGGTYVPPTGGAVDLGLFDDDEVTQALSFSFPYNGGTTSSLQICSNGFVSPIVGNGTSFFPDVVDFLGSPEAAWRAWHDFNPTEVGSGAVKFEEIGGIAYVTWDGVYDFGGTSAADANTLQFQFDAAGNVTIVFGTLSANGNDFLVGYSPAGASLDPGSVTLAAALPLTTTPDLFKMALSASPTPVSTPISGATVVYTTDNIPEFAPGSGLYIGINILSLTSAPAPGLDLTFLGAPGCSMFVASLDVLQSMVGLSPSQTVSLPLPAGVPFGTLLYSQSVSLITPNSLPNGQNAFGLTTSNGIESLISDN